MVALGLFLVEDLSVRPCAPPPGAKGAKQLRRQAVSRDVFERSVVELGAEVRHVALHYEDTLYMMCYITKALCILSAK